MNDDTVTLELRMTVTYKRNGVSVEMLNKLLEDVANYAAGDGLLTTDTSAEVETWSCRILEVT